MLQSWKKRMLYGTAGLTVLVSAGAVYVGLRPEEPKAVSYPVISKDLTTMTFTPKDGQIILLYGSDINRFKETQDDPQEPALMTTLSKTGKELKREAIADPDLYRMAFSQKVTDPRHMYIHHPDGIEADHFFTYDLKRGTFKKHQVPNTAITSVAHYGKDVWVTSNAAKPSENIQLINVRTDKRYPIEDQLMPVVDSPILELDWTIAYANNGTEDDQEGAAGMVLLDQKTGKSRVIRKAVEPYAYTALYGAKDTAYFATTDGMMIKLKTDGTMQKKSFSVLDGASYSSTTPMRMINNQTGYQIINTGENDTDQRLVKWTFGQAFRVEQVQPKFWKLGNHYRYLYRNPYKKTSYFTETDTSSSGKDRLIVTDDRLKTLRTIPIAGETGVDFVMD
ncbi:hypothetical protein [Exiguobacterium oxidotolerans]|uniref:Uncharacterized protein n=1 Tax=Exiguobacterium oxidotolerans TaxID=223958 RepID=A0A653II87_9BACL|nr:hypothetical protein [Exiguobacterium oxidotolerans]VWX38636.1 conserved hypothetical protein [Exiguobacterium oxidotolerans]